MMKLTKNVSDRNLDGMFRLKLLIYDGEKICVKIYVG